MAFIQSSQGLALLGFLMVASFTALVMSKRVSPIVALIATPIVFAVIAGAGGGIGPMVVAGVKQLAPPIVMITFAVLYFSLMLDAGLFEPLVNLMRRVTRDDPLRVTLSTAVVALIVGFSGDGTSTALIIVSSFLPVYRRLGMKTWMLGAIAAYAIGAQNLSPWAGPTPRAAAALEVDAYAIYLAILPAVIAGAMTVLAIAWLFGRAERRRLADQGPAPGSEEHAGSGMIGDPAARRPRLIWVNLALTLALFAVLISGLLSPVALFPIAAVLALFINYPSLTDQRARIASHAENLVSFILLFFGAGVFTGVLSGSGMIDAMAAVAVSSLPDGIGRLLAPVTALASMPMTYFMPHDAFYFGALPVLAKTGEAFGLTPLQMATASVLGQPLHILSPLLPSTYVFAAMLGVEPGDYLKKAVPWLIVLCLVIISAGLIFGAIPLFAPR